MVIILSVFLYPNILKPHMKTIKRHYRVERREIAFLKFIFEAYDGLATIETLDPGSSVLVFHIAPGCEPDVEMILGSLRAEILMEPVDGSDAFHP